MPPSAVSSPRPEDDEYLLVDFPSVEKLRSSTCGPTTGADNDDESIFTLSTTSLSDTDSDLGDDDEDSSTASSSRRVSFADDLVSDEWTRPYTPPEEVRDLYYSSEETQRFRQEYRLQRKLLSELSVDPDTFPIEDNEEELSAVASFGLASSNYRRGEKGDRRHHRISRVVVLHKDKLETFVGDEAPPEASRGGILPSLSPSFACGSNDNANGPDDFFDNDSFWSGSITWY